MTSEEMLLGQIQSVEHRLWGNGQPGEITKLSNRVSVLERVMWTGLGAILVMQFLTGSGSFSLMHFLPK